MIMVKVSANCWYAYAVETNYGGGVAGTRASPTAPTNGTLTGCSYPLEDQELPFEMFEREALHPMGSAASTRVIVNKSLKRDDIVIKQLAQSRVWADHAVVVTAGGSPDSSKSYCFHWENGVEYYNVYGMYLKKYKVIAKTRDFVIEELTFGYDKVDAGTALTQVAWITQAPLTWKDVAQPTFTATAFVDAEEVSVEFTNTYIQSDTFSSWRGIVPVLDARDIDIHILGHANVASKVETLYTEALTPFTCIAGNLVNAAGTAKDITVTNMKLGEDSKFNKLPGKGIVDYNFHLNIGGASAITIEA
jgi:hypothetical protein